MHWFYNFICVAEEWVKHPRAHPKKRTYFPKTKSDLVIHKMDQTFRSDNLIQHSFFCSFILLLPKYGFFECIYSCCNHIKIKCDRSTLYICVCIFFFVATNQQCRVEDNKKNVATPPVAQSKPVCNISNPLCYAIDSVSCRVCVFCLCAAFFDCAKVNTEHTQMLWMKQDALSWFECYCRIVDTHNNKKPSTTKILFSTNGHRFSPARKPKWRSSHQTIFGTTWKQEASSCMKCQ